MPTDARWPDLAGRSAIVTGGSRNMGRAFALGLARAGANVAILDLPAQAPLAADVVRACAEEGVRAAFAPVDIRDAASVEEAVGAAEASVGRIRVLVNNAARTDDDESPLADYPVGALDAQYEVGVRGTFLVTQAVARRLIAAGTGETGSVVNIASRVGQQVQTGSLGYAVAKAAVIHFSRVAALDLARHGIRVNAIGPGAIPRPQSEGPLPGVERFPLGRRLEYEDMVGTALYLASDASAMVTAQFIIVDGGLGLVPAY